MMKTHVLGSGANGDGDNEHLMLERQVHHLKAALCVRAYAGQHQPCQQTNEQTN